MIFVTLAFIPEPKLDLVRNPIAGFSTAGIFNGTWTEDQLYDQLEQMHSMDFARQGFDHFIIDDGWMLAERDALGNLQADPQKFPHGLDTFARAVDQAGFRLGIYASAGSTTRLGGAGSLGYEVRDAQFFKKLGVKYLRYDYSGSPLDGQLYAPDVVSVIVNDTVYDIYAGELTGDAFIADEERISGIGCRSGTVIFRITALQAGDANLRIKYVQSEEARVLQMAVNNRLIVEDLTHRTESMHPEDAGEAVFKVRLQKGSNVVQLQMNLSTNDLVYYAFVRMANELIGCNANTVFSASASGANGSLEWAPSVAHFWRYAPDVLVAQNECSFENIVRSLDDGLLFAGITGPNNYLDADLLCADVGDFSIAETRFHMSVLAALDAPMILSTNLSTINVSETIVLQNGFLPTITRDSLHLQAVLAESSESTRVLVKELSGTRVAVFMLNTLAVEQRIDFDLSQIQHLVVSTPGWSSAKQVRCTEIWSQDQRFVNVFDDPLITSDVGGHDAALWILEKYW